MFFISMIVHAFSNGFTDVLLLYHHLSEELARFLLYNYDKINAYLLKLHAGPGIRPKGSHRSTAIITVITIIKKGGNAADTGCPNIKNGRNAQQEKRL